MLKNYWFSKKNFFLNIKEQLCLCNTKWTVVMANQSSFYFIGILDLSLFIHRCYEYCFMGQKLHIYVHNRMKMSSVVKLTGIRPSLKWAKLFFSSVSRTFWGTTMNLDRLTEPETLGVQAAFGSRFLQRCRPAFLPGRHFEAVVDGADSPAGGAAPLQLLLPVWGRVEPVHAGVSAPVA